MLNWRVCSSKLLFTLIACSIAAACSGATPPATIDTNHPASDSERDGSVDSSPGADPFSGTFGDGGSGGPTSVDAACATQSTKALQQELDIYIMLDQSISMNEAVTGGTRWTAVASALGTFVNQPSLAGVSVGLQYFGVPPGGHSCPSSCKIDSDCGAKGPCVQKKCTGCPPEGVADSCNAADYAIPDVEIAPLPGVASTITDSIARHEPETSTPTSAALQGAVDHAKAWAQAHPGHVSIALFATDGDPAECDMSLTNINAIAAAAAAGTPRILTFVIGVGSSLTALNDIASAGGTGAAYIVDTSANVNQQFLDALNKIRGTALGCQYQIPVPTTGGSLDYGSVNVQYAAAGGAPVTVPKVKDKAMCPASGDAWYYDNDTSPTQILLCDTSCKSVTADTKGEVTIVVGCSTVVR